MSRQRLPEGGAEAIPLGLVIAILSQPHSSVSVLLMSAYRSIAKQGH